MPFSVEVGVSVAAYSKILDESKSTFFSEFAGLWFYFDSMTQKQIFPYSLNQWYLTFFHNPPFMESVAPNCPHKALSKNIKRSTHPQIYYFFT